MEIGLKEMAVGLRMGRKGGWWLQIIVLVREGRRRQGVQVIAETSTAFTLSWRLAGYGVESPPFSLFLLWDG